MKKNMGIIELILEIEILRDNQSYTKAREES